MNYFYIFLFAFLSALLGSMGLGGGGVLILFLTLFAGLDQLTAQGINLMFFIPIAFIATFIYHKKGDINWRKLIPIILPGIPGCFLGILISSFIGSEILGKIFGIGLIFLGFREFFIPSSKN